MGQSTNCPSFDETLTSIFLSAMILITKLIRYHHRCKKMQPYYGSHGGLEKLFKNDAQGIRGTRFEHPLRCSYTSSVTYGHCRASTTSATQAQSGADLSITNNMKSCIQIFIFLTVFYIVGKLWMPPSYSTIHDSETPETPEAPRLLGPLGNMMSHTGKKLSTVGMCCGYLCRHRSKGCSKAVHYVAIQYPHNQRFQKFAKVKG